MRQAFSLVKNKNVGTDSGIYRVSANNENVSVAVKDGVLTVTGDKVGSSILTVKQGDIERGKVTVTVEDTSPSIKEVTFAGNKLEKTPATLDEILTVDGIELTSSANISVDYTNGDAILFVDIEGTTANQYDEEDILLGVVEVVSADIANVSISEQGEIISGTASLTKDTKGTIALTITAKRSRYRCAND